MNRFMQIWLTWLLFAALPAQADEFARLYHEQARPIRLENGALDGPGAEFLRTATRDAQFVALGEDHDLHDIPPLTTALFRMLQAEHGFEYFATEQDPLSMEWISIEPQRGRTQAPVDWASRYPHGYSFVSDQELAMLGEIAARSRGNHHPIWGAEQAMGVSHYLDELLTLVEDPAVLTAIKALRDRAWVHEAGRKPVDGRRFIVTDRAKRAELLAIRQALSPREGSRVAFLLDAVLLSDEIYGYYVRAEEGEVVGLWNNWVREDWMKQRFSHHYRLAEAVDQSPPKCCSSTVAGTSCAVRGCGPNSPRPPADNCTDLCSATMR